MMTIEEETQFLINFLSHPAGFIVDVAGELCIFPIYEMREYWEVTWKITEDNISLELNKQFVTLEEAATFFVEKRRYMCLGSDFVKMAQEENE